MFHECFVFMLLLCILTNLNSLTKEFTNLTFWPSYTGGLWLYIMHIKRHIWAWVIYVFPWGWYRRCVTQQKPNTVHQLLNSPTPPLCHTLHIRLPQGLSFWLDSFCSSGKAVGVGAMCSCMSFRLCDTYVYMWEQRYTLHRISLTFMKSNKIK